MDRAAEEHEVARLQVRPAHALPAIDLSSRGVRQRDAHLGVHEHREAGAVEPAGAGRAPLIGAAEVLHRDLDDPAARRACRAPPVPAGASTAGPAAVAASGGGTRGLLRGLECGDLGLDAAEKLLALAQLGLDEGLATLHRRVDL